MSYNIINLTFDDISAGNNRSVTPRVASYKDSWLTGSAIKSKNNNDNRVLSSNFHNKHVIKTDKGSSNTNGLPRTALAKSASYRPVINSDIFLTTQNKNQPDSVSNNTSSSVTDLDHSQKKAFPNCAFQRSVTEPTISSNKQIYQQKTSIVKSDMNENSPQVFINGKTPTTGLLIPENNNILDNVNSKINNCKASIINDDNHQQHFDYRSTSSIVLRSKILNFDEDESTLTKEEFGSNNSANSSLISSNVGASDKLLEGKHLSQHSDKNDKKEERLETIFLDDSIESPTNDHKPPDKEVLVDHPTSCSGKESEIININQEMDNINKAYSDLSCYVCNDSEDLIKTIHTEYLEVPDTLVESETCSVPNSLFLNTSAKSLTVVDLNSYENVLTECLTKSLETITSANLEDGNEKCLSVGTFDYPQEIQVAESIFTKQINHEVSPKIHNFRESSFISNINLKKEENDPAYKLNVEEEQSIAPEEKCMKKVLDYNHVNKISENNDNSFVDHKDTANGKSFKTSIKPSSEKKVSFSTDNSYAYTNPYSTLVSTPECSNSKNDKITCLNIKIAYKKPIIISDQEKDEDLEEKVDSNFKINEQNSDFATFERPITKENTSCISRHNVDEHARDLLKMDNSASSSTPLDHFRFSKDINMKYENNNIYNNLEKTENMDVIREYYDKTNNACDEVSNYSAVNLTRETNSNVNDDEYDVPATNEDKKTACFLDNQTPNNLTPKEVYRFNVLHDTKIEKNVVHKDDQTVSSKKLPTLVKEDFNQIKMLERNEVIYVQKHSTNLEQQAFTGYKNSDTSEYSKDVSCKNRDKELNLQQEKVNIKDTHSNSVYKSHSFDDSTLQANVNQEKATLSNRSSKLRNICWESRSGSSQSSTSAKSPQQDKVMRVLPISLPVTPESSSSDSYPYSLREYTPPLTYTAKTFTFHNGTVDEMVEIRRLSQRFAGSNLNKMRIQSTPNKPTYYRTSDSNLYAQKDTSNQVNDQKIIPNLISTNHSKKTNKKNYLEYYEKDKNNNQISRWKYLEDLSQRQRNKIHVEQLSRRNGKSLDHYLKKERPQFLEINRKIIAKTRPKCFDLISDIDEKLKSEGCHVSRDTIKRGVSSPLEYGSHGVRYKIIPSFVPTFKPSGLLSKQDFA